MNQSQEKEMLQELLDLETIIEMRLRLERISALYARLLVVLNERKFNLFTDPEVNKLFEEVERAYINAKHEFERFVRRRKSCRGRSPANIRSNYGT